MEYVKLVGSSGSGTTDSGRPTGTGSGSARNPVGGSWGCCDWAALAGCGSGCGVGRGSGCGSGWVGLRAVMSVPGWSIIGRP